MWGMQVWYKCGGCRFDICVEVQVCYTCGDAGLVQVWGMQAWYKCGGCRFDIRDGGAGLVYVWGCRFGISVWGAGLVQVWGMQVFIYVWEMQV